MKIKFMITVLMVAIAIVAVPTVFAGDPVPGVDVSVERSPGGIVIAEDKTDAQGMVIVKKVVAGSYVIVFKPIPLPAEANNNYNSAKSNTAGLKVSVGDKIIVKKWKNAFVEKFELKIQVPAGEPQRVSIEVEMLPDSK